MRNTQEQPITFRRATVADSLAVAQVHVQSWRESFTGIVPQSFLDKMSAAKRAQAFRTRFAVDFYRMFIAETPENVPRPSPLRRTGRITLVLAFKLPDEATD